MLDWFYEFISNGAATRMYGHEFNSSFYQLEINGCQRDIFFEDLAFPCQFTFTEREKCDVKKCASLPSRSTQKRGLNLP